MSKKLEIVKLINKGKGNVEISKELSVSPSLVRKYRSLLIRGKISCKGLPVGSLHIGGSRVKKTIKVGKIEKKVKKHLSKHPSESVKEEEKREVSSIGGYVDHQEIVPKIEAGLSLGYNIALRGKTSTAKTFLVTELAKKHNKTLHCFNASVNTTVDEVKGKFVLRYDKHGKPKPEWLDSSLVKAMRNGDWVVIEEINFLSEDLLSVFYSILDDRKNIILDEKDGEVVNAHPDFRVFSTMNWSYKGTNELNDALKRRFRLWVDLDYLPKELEVDLILNRVNDAKKGEVNILVEYAESYRNIKTRNKTDLGTDTLIRCAELSTIIPLKQALEHTLIPVLAYESDEKKVIREQFNLLLRNEEIKDKYKIGDILRIKEYSKYKYIYVLNIEEGIVTYLTRRIKKQLLKDIQNKHTVRENSTTLTLDSFHSLIMENQKKKGSD